MEALRNILGVPFGWALGFLYDLSGNYLFTLVVITLIVRLILLPSAIKQQKNSAKQMRLQAKVNKIRAKYAGQGREAQMKISEETQELYRREGFNASTAGCLPMGLQLLVMMGLYNAIYSPIKYVLHLSDQVIEALQTAYYAAFPDMANAKSTYSLQLNILNKFTDVQAHLPEGGVVSEEAIAKIQNFIDNFRIGSINLTDYPKDWRTVNTLLVWIPIIAGVTALLSAVYTYLKQRKTNPEMAKNPAMGCMTLASPAMSIYFGFILPAGIGFYWIISNVLSFIQLLATSAMFKPADVIAQQMIDETVQRRAREASVKKTRAYIAQERENR
ncbi:MAG: YidC/Oxa1 family membrane protein insertase [Clostridia bacterium]|nr:YidC/Oxa1 family membrane protein insertase [Clostridia bacterium]